MVLKYVRRCFLNYIHASTEIWRHSLPLFFKNGQNCLPFQMSVLICPLVKIPFSDLHAIPQNQSCSIIRKKKFRFSCSDNPTEIATRMFCWTEILERNTAKSCRLAVEKISNSSICIGAEQIFFVLPTRRPERQTTTEKIHRNNDVSALPIWHYCLYICSWLLRHFLRQLNNFILTLKSASIYRNRRRYRYQRSERVKKCT